MSTTTNLQAASGSHDRVTTPAYTRDTVPPPSRDPRFYRPELDGLRFFAFLAVYLNHTLIFRVEGGVHHHISPKLATVLGTIGVAGAFGVDLFFALSAYLITELLLRERSLRGMLDLRRFYLRRILRIWPLYFLVILLACVTSLFVPSERLNGKLVLGFLLLAGNWAYIVWPIGTIIGPLWSVSVEEQFYLLWPIAVRRSSVRRIAMLAVMILLIGLSLRVVIASSVADSNWITKNSLTRIDGIAAGILIAVVLRSRVITLGRSTRIATACAAIALMLFLAQGPLAASAVASPLAVALGWSAVAAASAAILVSALGQQSFPGSALSWSPLVYLGKISYGLYVYHQVGLRIAGWLFPLHWQQKSQYLGYFTTGLASTIALAAISYRWFETPFLRLKERYAIVRSRPTDAGATSTGPFVPPLTTPVRTSLTQRELG